MAFLKLIPLWAWVAIALGAVIGVQTVRLNVAQNATQRAKDAHQATKVENARVLQEIAALTAKAQADVRLREVQYAQDAAYSRNQAQQEARDAKARADRTAADLRAGITKLRSQWASCSGPAANGPEAGTAGPGSDEAADLRSSDIGHLRGLGAAADTWITALQREVLNTRKACNIQ